MLQGRRSLVLSPVCATTHLPLTTPFSLHMQADNTLPGVWWLQRLSQDAQPSVQTLSWAGHQTGHRSHTVC